MIGRLRGLLVHKQPPQLLVEVGGVGYELEAPMSTFYVLPETGDEVLLYTHLHVREDAQQLFGFAAEGDRALFRELLKVNGVGARVALAILSGMDAETFAVCVHAGDSTRLTRLPGIGKKTAERLIVELRDRLPELPSGERAATQGKESIQLDHAEEEAVSALVALGYRLPEASRMVAAIAADGLNAEAMIRLALKAVVR